MTLYPMLAGGGYGRKLEIDAIEQAAIIAQSAASRPVQLTWPRIQEIVHDRYRPPAAARMTAWVAQGRMQGWQARIAAPRDRRRGRGAAVRRAVGAALVRPDGAAAPFAGAAPPLRHRQLRDRPCPADIGIQTGYWRGAAHSYTGFFTESFIDELARRWGSSRCRSGSACSAAIPRLARALTDRDLDRRLGRRRAGQRHGHRLPQRLRLAHRHPGRGRGDRRPELRCRRAVCAVDCGRMVNPEIVKQQIEGGLIHGISAAIGKPLDIVRGVPTRRRSAPTACRCLRDAPEVSVELIDSDEAPGGVTELAVPTAAPAVANAYFSLTGQRVRTLPIVVGAGMTPPPTIRRSRRPRSACC